MALVGAKNDHQLAKACGVAQTTISTWRQREKIPYELCVRVAIEHEASVDWIIFGKKPNLTKKGQEFGYIEASLYKLSWRTASMITEKYPEIDTAFGAMIIYNGRIELVQKMHGEGLSPEQAILALTVMDDLSVGQADRYTETVKKTWVERKQQLWGYPEEA